MTVCVFVYRCSCVCACLRLCALCALWGPWLRRKRTCSTSTHSLPHIPPIYLPSIRYYYSSRLRENLTLASAKRRVPKRGSRCTYKVNVQEEKKKRLLLHLYRLIWLQMSSSLSEVLCVNQDHVHLLEVIQEVRES